MRCDIRTVLVETLPMEQRKNMFLWSGILELATPKYDADLQFKHYQNVIFKKKRNKSSYEI